MLRISGTCFYKIMILLFGTFLVASFFVLLLTNFVPSVSVAQLNRDDDFMKIDGEWYKG